MSNETITVVEPGFRLLTPVSWIEQYPTLLETCGRVCYKSEGKATSESAEKFIRALVKSGHESVIEHMAITVAITCDRACSHQIVRHRLGAYSQESQRYCDYGKLGFQVICPPSVAKLVPGEYAPTEVDEPCLPGWRLIQRPPTHGIIHDRRTVLWLNRMSASYNAYLLLRKEGIKPEDARSVLPNATKTEVVTTFNLRQWRHVFQERALNAHAQWQIREIMGSILRQFSELLPCVFYDQALELDPSLALKTSPFASE